MRYKITREQLKNSKNPYVKELFKAGFYAKKYNYADPLHQIKLDYPRKDPRPVLLIDGKEYLEGVDIESEMRNHFGEEASNVARAYSQNFLAQPGYFVQMSLGRALFSPHQGEPGYHLISKKVANLFKKEKECLDAKGEDFPIAKSENPVECDFIIPGTIKISHTLDPNTKENQLEEIGVSNGLLYKICMEEIVECEQYLLDPEINDEILSIFYNSILKDGKKNPDDLIYKISPKNIRLKDWLENFLIDQNEKIKNINGDCSFHYAEAQKIGIDIIIAKKLLKKVSAPSASIEKLVELQPRENIVQSVFGFMRIRVSKQKEGSYLRYKLPGDHLDEVENFLVDQLVYGQDYTNLSYVEFLQLAHFAVEDFEKNAENNAARIPLSFKDTQKKGRDNYYESSLLLRIRQGRFEIVRHHGSLLRNLKELELTQEKMREFSEELVEFFSGFWKKNSSFFPNESNALQALCKDIFRINLDDEKDIDELIYRFMYLLKYNKVQEAGPFIQILLDEAIHLKIIRNTGWLVCVANEFRESKLPIYESLIGNICEDINKLIQRNESAQKSERAQALQACWVVGENGKTLFEQAEEGSEDCAVGLAMEALSKKLVDPWDEHFKAHHVCLSRDKYVSKNRDKLVHEVERIIEKEISSKQELTQYDGLAERIRIYIQNIFMTVFSAGIAPLVRKYALNKSAFFTPPREEIIESVPQQLRAVKSG